MKKRCKFAAKNCFNRIKMKKILFISMLLILCISNAAAQKTAEIKFDKQTYNFGKFSESNPVQKCTFNFTTVVIPTFKSLVTLFNLIVIIHHNF